MAAIDFPVATFVGQQFVALNGVTYTWNGTLWLSTGASAGGDVYVVGSIGSNLVPTSMTVVTSAIAALFVMTGNAGNWWNSATGRWTPPAGRYHIIASISAVSGGGSSLMLCSINKNGTQITIGQNTTAATNLAANVTADAQVDMNGTDFIDMRIASVNFVGTANALSFSAFPISGIKGPPGDPGQLGFRLLQRIVPTVTPNIDIISIPGDINDLQYELDVTPASNGRDMVMQFYLGGVLQTATYGWANVTGVHTQNNSAAGVLGSAGVGVFNGVYFDATLVGNVIGNVSGIRVRGEITNIRDAARLKHTTYQASYINELGTLMTTVNGSGYLATAGVLTGLRFLPIPASNFAAGGAITLWGSP